MLKHVRLKKGSHAQTRKEGVEKECSPSSTKYRGPVDSTAGAQELGEHKEDVPWSFLCPDAADQELDDTACWQIAARKMQIMQEQALAVRQEEELAADLGQDKTGRKLLLNTCKEFQAAVGKVMAQSTMQTLERALQAEVGPPQENTPGCVETAMAVDTQAATPKGGGRQTLRIRPSLNRGQMVHRNSSCQHAGSLPKCGSQVFGRNGTQCYGVMVTASMVTPS